MADQSGTRRDVLKSIGVAGAGGAAGLSATGGATALEDADAINQLGDVRTDSSPGRTVRIDASGSVQYAFAVTGVVSADGAPAAAVGAGEVSARTDSGTHTFKFSGEFTEFTLDGDAEVSVDGERFDVAAFPQNTLEIVPDGQVSYDVSASGAVVVDEGQADQPNRRTASADATARHVLSYSGELTYLEIDGDATLRRNGTRVTVDDALPSTLPNEFTAAARSSEEYTLDVTQKITTADGTRVDVGESGQFTEGTTGRYGGRLQRIEHPSGASIEFDHADSTVVCHAPSGTSATFTVRTDRGLIHHDDNEAYDAVNLSASDGETATATWFGDVTKIAIDDLTVRFKPDTHPEANVSARLQTAAVAERTTAYRRLTEIADGRVRHDAAGIAAGQLFQADSGNNVVTEFRLANLERADRGIMSVRKSDAGVQSAKIRYEQLADGDPTSVEVVGLPTDGDPSTDKLRRETTDIDEPPASERGGSAKSKDELYAADFAGSPEPKSRAEVEAKRDLSGYDEWVAANDQVTTDKSWWDFIDWAWEFVEQISKGSFWGRMYFLWEAIAGNFHHVAMFEDQLYVYVASTIKNVYSKIKSIKETKAGTGVFWACYVGFRIYELVASGFFHEVKEQRWKCASCIAICFIARELALVALEWACGFTGPFEFVCYYGIVTVASIITYNTSVYYARTQICGGQIPLIHYC
jgi:hypothetical protein